MNPAQLLNPKAFAKEKAKEKQKPKPPATYDPKALLNPTASLNGQKQATKDDEEDQRGFGAAQMIENLNGITQRTELPVKKRKIQTVDEDEEGQPNKPKSTFQGGSGMISEHLKEERKKAAAETSLNGNKVEPIDLTQDDDEVQIIKENVNERVCLGVLHGSANVFRVPAVAANAMRSFKDYWPRTKVNYTRLTSANHVIHLQDRSGAKFATLDVKISAALAPLLDGAAVNKIEVKVWLADRERKAGEAVGDKVSQSLKVEIIIYAPRSKSSQIGKWLSQKQLFLSTPVINTGTEVFNPHDLHRNFGGPTRGNQQISSVGTGARTIEQILRETSSMFDSLSKDEDLPDMEADSSIITSPLMEHQKKALHFLMDRERSDYEGQELPSHSLWKFRSQDNGRPSWYHLITDQVVFEKPDYIQGGILADVMGLGKTLSILSLIAETREAARRFRREEGPDVDGEELINAKATLIICPKSVLSNWQEQIRKHTAEGKLKFYTYHGSNRMQDLEKLAKYDIVLTSYNTAASELHGKLNALMFINWFRIVLDEAHSIRNASTQISKGCCALYAERRWAITGTPVQNSLHDLGALFKFLQLSPFNSPGIWAQYIMAPFKNGDVNVIEQLQILVRGVTLRRTKNTIDLPQKTVQRVRLKFTTDEFRLYKQFSQKAGMELHGITQGGTAIKGKAYAHILKSIGRMRAICAHGKEMLTEEDLQDLQGSSSSNAIVLDIGDDEADDECFVREKQAYDLLNTFFDSEADSCQSCGNKLVKRDDPNNVDDMSDSEEDEEQLDDSKDLLGHLTPCYHLICANCTERHEKEVQASLTVDNFHTCVHCESYVKFELFPLRQSVLERIRGEGKDKSRAGAARWDEDTYTGPSSKVKALLQDLKESAEESKRLPPGEPPIRSVVFSGWTLFLDLIQHALHNEGIASTRIDGSMSVKQRSQALQTFNTDDSVRVLLVSIKAGGQGLNFTSANKAYVMEPGYNPAAEHQAVDRVHRIGQKRDVVIKHFIMEGSVEEKVLKLQEKKEALATLSMERKKAQKGNEAKQRLDDLKELFK